MLEAWIEFEKESGTTESLQNIIKMMPKRVKKRRKLYSDSGEEVGYDEYYDYIFPDEEDQKPALSLFEAALKWKAEQANK